MDSARETSELVKHKGGCHCKKVRFEVDAPAEVTALDCNCSICSMKRNTHFIVPNERFHLLPPSEENLQLYQFGTMAAKHYFCKACGICSFYIPRSNPHGVAITVHCLDEGTLKTVNVDSFDGQRWEEAYARLCVKDAKRSSDA